MDKISLNSITDDRIEILQKQVDVIQIKLLQEKKKKWFNNPSLWLSIIALITSLIFSTRAIIEQQKDKIEQANASKLGMIRQTIESLIAEENNYLQIASNPNNQIEAKSNAYLTFTAKTSSLLDKISNIMDSNTLIQIEPSLLINYGRLLSSRSRYEKACETFKIAQHNASDSLTKSVALRNIANIYANPSFPKFDSTMSRKLRRKDIYLSRQGIGDQKFIRLSDSYELWADDEYFLLKNISNGNLYTDSALFFINKLPDYNSNKISYNNRLKERYNYYNKILLQNNVSGEYDIYTSDGKSGDAYITSTPQGLWLKIEFYGSDKKLNEQGGGNGYFVNLDKLKFDIGTEKYISFQPLVSGKGTLTLTTQKGEKLSGYFYEYEKKPIKYILTKRNK